ncbi:MAG: HAD-IC family P-type ATPase, partial [Eubacterium sp.]|nr:HAD-IC family P-type ATPase [Eubacterium sp.]
VMDKTGTLTKGKFEVSDIFPMNDFSREDVLKYAAVAESNSNHPIAQSIVQAYGTQTDELVVSQKESAGYGVEAVIGGHRILAGNAKMMTQYKIACSKMEEHTGTQVYVAVDETLAGIILITDEIKKDSRYAIQKMKKMGVEQIVMLTGDSEKVGKKVAGELGIDAAYTELLPQDKVEIFEKIISQRNNNKKTVFVGDGINDAPVLARADIGIAMGALGSDAAIEAADVVLMTDEPSKIATAICIVRKTKRIVWENILFAMGIKILVLILAALGTATMWEAVFGDVGVTVLAVLNSMRAMRVKNINMQD